MWIDFVVTLVVLAGGFAGLVAWVRRDTLRPREGVPPYDSKRPHLGHAMPAQRAEMFSVPARAPRRV